MPVRKILVPIFNKKGLDPQEYLRQIDKALDSAAKDIEKDYKSSVRTWNTKVDFEITKPNRFERIIGTNNKIYNFVSGGTKPHVITPKRAPRLRFQTGYRPKTTQRIASRAGGRFGPVVTARRVNHPGTKARNYPEKIGRKNRRIWAKKNQEAINKAAQV